MIKKQRKKDIKKMKQFHYHLTDENGLHARPAGMLATFSKRYLSDICVRANGKEANCKRLLSLMTLGAVKGTELVFTITGPDEELAATELEQFCLDGMKNDHASPKDQ